MSADVMPDPTSGREPLARAWKARTISSYATGTENGQPITASTAARPPGPQPPTAQPRALYDETHFVEGLLDASRLRWAAVDLDRAEPLAGAGQQCAPHLRGQLLRRIGDAQARILGDLGGEDGAEGLASGSAGVTEEPAAEGADALF